MHAPASPSGAPALPEKVDKETDRTLELHFILDNYATHKHPKVKAWLEKHPRVHFHFVPTSSSWLNPDGSGILF